VLKILPFIGVVAVGVGSLVFDLTLSSRLPSDADWAEAAGALRARTQPGDAVQIWPVWAERARLFVDTMPVLAEEDLAGADYAGVRRLWLLTLPRTPFYQPPEPALTGRRATPVSDEQRFGALSLRAWDLHNHEIAADLTASAEQHEVDYVARRCVRVPISAHFAVRGAAGTALHVRAGVIGERAYDADRPPVAVRVVVDGTPLVQLDVPRTDRDGTGWRKADVPLPPGAPDRDFEFSVSSPDAGRPFCLAAWTTR